MKNHGSSKDPLRVQQFLKSYARNVQTPAKNVTILEDMLPNDVGITAPTMYAYYNALQRLFSIVETPAWAPNIWSKTAIRTSCKRGFVDPSIAAAVLGKTPDSLLIQRFWRDNHLTRIGGGTDEVMLEIISRQLGM